MKILRLFVPLVVLIFLEIILSLAQIPENVFISGITLLLFSLWFVVRIVVSFINYNDLSPEEIRLKYLVSGATFKKLLSMEAVFIVYMIIYQMYLYDPNTSTLSPLFFFVVAEYGTIFLVVYATYLYEKRLALKRHLVASSPTPFAAPLQANPSITPDKIKRESSKSIWGFWIATSTLIFGGITSLLLFYGVKMFFFSCAGGLCSSEEIQKNLMVGLFLGGVLIIVILVMYAIFALGYFVVLFFCIKRYKANS